MDGMPDVADEVVRTASRYDFETFTVGVSLPEGLQEREDELRSVLKIKGKETAKAQAAHIAAEAVSKALRKEVDRFRPDLTLLVDLGRGSAVATSRPLYFYGRYSKPRGVPQRREFCANCSGSGCPKCRGTGFKRGPSVELLVGKRLAKMTKSDRMRFTWMGSEDRGSRVRPPGRPFVVEVKSPVERRVSSRFVARFGGGQVSVSEGRVLPSKPLRLPPFKFRTRIVGTVRGDIDRSRLDELEERFSASSVRFDRPDDKPTEKTVYRMSARLRGKKLTIDAELDGGLPVKRLVGGELVSPSVSEVLKAEVRCRTFDICGVEETGEFEFAEVAWSQKKN